MAVTWNASFPTITVELGFATATSGTGVWDTSLWDTGTWGPDVVWTDVTAYVQALRTRRGRERETDRYDGEAEIVFDNRDARFTPTNLSGPYVAAGVTQIRPRVPVRISATWSSVTYRLFTGRVDDWADVLTEQGLNATTVVQAVDTFGDLARYNGAAQAEQGGGEGTGARMQRILANAGWVWDTQIQPGTMSVQPTTLADNALTEVLLTCDSEGGNCWADGDGSFVFEGIYSALESSRSNTVQMTFGDGASEVPPRDIELSYTTDQLANIVSLSRAGGTQQTASDLTSRALYGDIGFSRNDLICETDGQVASLAGVTLVIRRNPEYRVVALSCDPVVSPSVAWPAVLARRFRDRVRIDVPVRASNTTLNQTAFVEGVEHEISQLSWSVRFTFSSTSVADSFSSPLWDGAIWDTDIWFY